MTAPKLFVSYSWTNPDHEDWVLNLATDLRSVGIDVILDKWHLREGQDANEFMESMVSDPTIEKVMMVCDRGYKEKADGRKGGAGIEAQILTPHLYKQKDEGKFVAVLSERGDQGEAFVPNYYASRLYIDLSDPTRHGEMFERLVRWVYNKPVHEAPALGDRPSYLQDDAGRIRLETAVSHTRAIEALRGGRPRLLVAVREYLDTLIKELKKFRLRLSGVDDQPAAVRTNVDHFLPYRNQFIDLISTVTTYAPGSEAAKILHKFFEQALGVCHESYAGSFTSWDNANLRFIVYELFVSTIAIELRHEQFDMASILINDAYYVGGLQDFHDTEMISFNAFLPTEEPFRAWWNGKERNPVSAVADLINERVGYGEISMRHVCAVDLLLALRSVLNAEDYRRWVAMTTVYAGHSRSALELFARCQSASYFDKLKPLLGVADLDDFRQRVAQFDKEGRRGYVTLSSFGSSVAAMTGIERVASRR